MPKQLDFSGQAETVTAAAAPLDFSALAAPAAIDPQVVAAFRAQHASDVPLPPSLDTRLSSGGVPSLRQRAENMAAGAGDAFTASLIRTPNALNLASGGLNSLLGLTANADADFARAQALQAQADQYQRSAQEASPNGAIAGNVLGIVPKLVSPAVLAVDALSHGTDLGTRAIDQNVSVPRAEALMLEGNVAGLAQNLLPGNLPGNLLTRALSGAAINAGTQAAEQGVEHVTAPEVVGAPTVKDATVAGGIGAILAAALGHGAARPVGDGQRLVADPVPQGLPRGADYSAKAEPIRPAPVDLGGNVTVNAQGEAATPQQGAAAFTAAMDAMRGRTTPPALGEPVVAVDAAGRAATTADQNAALQPAAPAPLDPLGLTERQRALIAADPRTAREGAPIGPKALPPPVVTVDRTGQAQTTSQIQQALQRQQQAAAERRALGITPDIERTQGARWAKQDQAARENAERAARLAELDQAITAKEQANRPARRRNAQPDETVDDALTFLAKRGGLDRRSFVQEGIDPAVARAPENKTRGGASRPLFRAQGAGGMSLDQVAETLWQHGYLPSADNNAALDLIMAGVNHDTPTYSIHRQDQGDLLALQQAKQDAENAPPADYADVPFSRKPAMSREQFLGNPTITSDANAKDLQPRVLTSVASAPAEPFMGGQFEAKFSPDGAVVLDNGKPIASYNFGDTLAVAKPYRRQGIATELVAAWRSRFPDAPAAKTRTKAAQRVQEKAYDLLKQRDPSFSFAGERAQTADRGALAQAQQMEAMGRDSVPDRYGNQPGSPEDTHLATGWHRGVDGKWRFEIDDSAATVNRDVLEPGKVRSRQLNALIAARQEAFKSGDTGEVARLSAQIKEVAATRAKVPRATVGEVLNHPELLRAYPELANVKVRVNPLTNSWASYNTGENTIEIRDPSAYPAEGNRSLKSVLLHEIQHAIQAHEGFARGGNAREVRSMPEFEQTLRQYMADHDGQLPSWSDVRPHDDAVADKAAHEVYRRLAGEVEARNTQTRMTMDAGQRRAVPPSETADVPRSQQIVRFNNPTTAERSGQDAQQAQAKALTNVAASIERYIGQRIRLTPAAGLPDALSRALAAWGDAFGVEPVIFDNQTPEVFDFQGVNDRKGHIFINADSPSPILAVSVHETLHQMEVDAPDLHQELIDEMDRQGRLDAYGENLRKRAAQSGENPDRLDARTIRNELIADAAGDAMLDPAFVERLAQRNPALFRRLADYFLQSLKTIISKLRDLGSSKYLRDVEAFHTKLADVLERYATRQQDGRGDRSASEPALSRKAAATDQTQTPEFARWFGDSKVVDAEGKPLVVYHGTGAEFDSFSAELSGSANGEILGRGFYFTPHESDAMDWAGSNGGNPRVIAAFLSIKNPFEIGSRAGKARDIPPPHADLVRDGYDGIISRNASGEIGEVVAFHPEQIKSATGNRGTFDPNEPSILFSRKPSAGEADHLPASADPALPRFNRATELWQERVGKPVFDALGKATKALVANDLLKRHGLNLAEDMPAAARDAWRQYRIDLGKAQKAAHDIAKGAGHFTPAERALVSDYIEREMKAGVVPPAHVVKTAQMMTAALTHQSEELVRLGMLSPAAKARWEGRYLPRFYEKHILANPFDKALRAVYLQGIKGSHLRGRGLLESIAVKDVPKYQSLGWELRGKDGKPVSLAGRKPTDTVQVWRDFTAAERAKMGEVRDGLYRFARGYTDTQRDIALGRLFARIADTVAREDNPGGWVQVPDTTVPDTGVKRFGKLAGKWVPGDVLAELKAKAGPSSELAKLYLKALSLWKEGKTSLNPVTHVNNVVSNIIMADLAGLNVADPRSYAAYAAAFKHYKNRSALYQEAQEAGLFGGEWFGNEIHQYLPIPGELKAAASTGDGAAAFVRKALGVVSKGREAMGRLYGAEDAFFKFLLYLQARSRGVAPDDAVDWAHRWVFDYSTAAPGVRKLKNTVIPFANYGAKAIPALAFAATHYPWRVAKWMALLGGFALYSFQSVYGDKRKEGQAMEGELLPDYLKGGSAFFGVPKALRLPWNDESGTAQYVDISRFLPMGDLFDADNQMGGVPLPAPFMPNNPLLTTAYAMLANKDSFTGREVTRDTDTAGEAAAKRLGWLYRQMAPNNPLVPGTYNFNRLANAAAAASGHQLGPYTGTDYEGVTMSPGRAVAQTAGVKLRSVDLGQEQDRRIRALAYEIRELRGEARQLMRNGTMPADAKDKRLATIRAKLEARSADIAKLRALPVPEVANGR